MFLVDPDGINNTAHWKTAARNSTSFLVAMQHDNRDSFVIRKRTLPRALDYLRSRGKRAITAGAFVKVALVKVVDLMHQTRIILCVCIGHDVTLTCSCGIVQTNKNDNCSRTTCGKLAYSEAGFATETPHP